jgi:hypothetical protein
VHTALHAAKTTVHQHTYHISSISNVRIRPRKFSNAKRYKILTN